MAMPSATTGPQIALRRKVIVLEAAIAEHTAREAVLGAWCQYDAVCGALGNDIATTVNALDASDCGADWIAYLAALQEAHG